MDKKNKKIPSLHFIMRGFAMLFLSIALTVCGYKFASANSFDFHVVGESMSPTLADNEYGIGIKFETLRTGIKRGDIICFLPPINMTGEIIYVKRVIGLPGETVEIKNGRVYVDGRLLDEAYLDCEWTKDNGPYYFEVPEGHYLVLGDNRNDSYDSRNWDNPYVDYWSIQAKALFIYKPVLNFRYLY